MRYCPVCDERYDDEVIKFCTKDGTPLVDDGAPNFVILPSVNAEAPPDDLGEETVIRRKGGSGTLGLDDEPERIVIPTTETSGQRVRQRAQVYYEPPPPPNTAKTIVLTILGTLVVLSFGAGLMWLFQKEPPANMNINTNPFNLNADLNANLGFNSNFNFNANFNTNANAGYVSNYNFNFNMNAYPKTPTNTPTPKQTPTPSPSPAVPSPSPSPRPPVNTRPPISPAPRPPSMMTNRPAGNRN